MERQLKSWKHKNTGKTKGRGRQYSNQTHRKYKDPSSQQERKIRRDFAKLKWREQNALPGSQSTHVPDFTSTSVDTPPQVDSPPPVDASPPVDALNSDDIRNTEQSEGNNRSKMNRFSQAENKFMVKKEALDKKRQSMQKQREEREQALKEYRDKKRRKNLLLCKKTRKGQPVMKNQINYLLEKIEKQYGSNR